MKRYIARKIARFLRAVFPEIQEFHHVRSQLNLLQEESRHKQVEQTQLLLHYQFLLHQNLPRPQFRDTGFRVYSQCDEDGLLLYIFSLIGTHNKCCLDLAFGSPYAANTTNLLCNWGWQGVLIEGNARLAQEAEQFFVSQATSMIFPPTVVQAHVTAENINQLLEQQGLKGEIDLFSLDVDGVDYWLWKALDIVDPRVVIVEYQDIWGAEASVTVPYSADFNRLDTHPDYCGASLAAFVRLGKEKNYRLIGCNQYGFNAFFMRNDVGRDLFPEISIQQCLQHPKVKHGQRSRLPAVKNYTWIDV